MGDKELNIKSSTIEKGLDLVKDFVDKLFSPAIGEIGGLLADRMKFLRGKHQIEILLKAKEYVARKNIDVKQIPLKILVPFLEMASLEEDEQLQDKWAKMLANMADSKTNLQNQIFPYILSQISIEEFDGLKQLLSEEMAYSALQKKVSAAAANKIRLINFKNEDEKEIDRIKLDGFKLKVEEYEKENLLRLGLIRQLTPRIYIEEFRTGGESMGYGSTTEEQWHNIAAEYDPDDFGYRLSELGDLFLDICEIKENT